MFNQTKYINQYIKDNYRTIKVRVRNDEKIINEKLDSVGNVNQYLRELIMQDILKHSDFVFLDSSVQLNFVPSKELQHLINHAEFADVMKDYGSYLNYASAIDSQAKYEVTHHLLDESQWNLLLKRYHL